MKEIYIEQLRRFVWIRPGTSDDQDWDEVFKMNYHVPPQEMPTPSTVLDLGANIGITAVHYREMWPEAIILAVEMDRENADLARKNFSGLVWRRAVTTASTTHVYYKTQGISADAYAISEYGGRIASTIHPLTLCAEFFGNVPIDFCKMDVEGSEWEILKVELPIKHLLVEFHDEPRDGPKIVKRGIELLESMGYDAHHHTPHPQAVFAVKR